VLFVLYPGFSQQFIAFLYSHFYIVLLSFLLSLYLMVLALRRPGWYWPLTIAALALSLFNMLSMEYFFLLDVLRMPLIWFVLSEREKPARQRLITTVLAWLPYLVLFLGAVYWRSVLFGFQTYQPAFLDRLRINPTLAVLELLPRIAHDIWQATVGAWVLAFTPPDGAEAGQANLIRYWMLAGGAALVTIFYWLLRGENESRAVFDGPGSRWSWAPRRCWWPVVPSG
jgi:hypothetical protein